MSEKHPSPESLSLINEMQARLAERFFGAQEEENVLRWIQENSSKFREIINAHPEYIEEYKQDPETLLSKVESELYKETDS